MSMKEYKTKKDPVTSDQAGRMMAVDPLGINSSPDEVKRKFNANSAREDVVRQRAYEILRAAWKRGGLRPRPLAAGRVRIEIVPIQASNPELASETCRATSPHYEFSIKQLRARPE
jgi:hypothetical protein